MFVDNCISSGPTSRKKMWLMGRSSRITHLKLYSLEQYLSQLVYNDPWCNGNLVGIKMAFGTPSSTPVWKSNLDWKHFFLSFLRLWLILIIFTSTSTILSLCPRVDLTVCACGKGGGGD